MNLKLQNWILPRVIITPVRNDFVLMKKSFQLVCSLVRVFVAVACAPIAAASAAEQLPVQTPTWPEYVDMLAAADPKGVEQALIRAVEKGDAEARVELAVQSLLGRFRYFGYKAAAEELLKLGDRRSARVVDYYALHWLLMKHPDTDFRHSKVNAYLSAREALRVNPESSVRKALPAREGFSEITSMVSAFQYREQKDPMTDEFRCQLSTEETNGISLQMDTKGVYVKGTPTLAGRQHEQMGVRVDAGEFFRGLLPDSVAEYDKYAKALTTLFVNGQIDQDNLKKAVAEKAHLLSADRVYVAHAGSTEFDRLLGQLALGNVVRIRGIKPTGESVIAELDMTVDLGGQLGRANLFDLYGYVYLDCVYNLLSERTKK